MLSWKIALVPLLLAVGMHARAQQSTGPATFIFNNPKDSLEYAQLEEKLSKRFQAAIVVHNFGVTDSIMVVRRKFLDNHPYVMRTAYGQGRYFTPYQLLPKIANKDSITKISVLGHGRRRLPDSLYRYKNLTELELIDFKISKIPRKLAKSSLKSLAIYNNFPERRLRLPKSSSITFLSIRGDENGKLPKSYNRLRNLQVLQLSRNNLKVFPTTGKCDKLSRLDLTFNAITVIPSSVAECVHLKSLNLSNNKVEKIEPGIGQLKMLEELSLYKNDLKELPLMLYTMTSLRVIDLYYNHIPKVTPAIGNLKNLEILYLANNEIYSIPDEIGELANLKELYLHHNKLSNLPVSIGNLTSISTLRINNNGMIEWPKGVSNLKGLTNFDCSFNQFESLPIAELDFSKMKILSLGGNPWDPKLKDNILEWVDMLRERETVVHIDDKMQND